MAATLYYPRFIEKSLAETLSDTPVVLIHGPRQCGKTTLAQRFGKTRGYAYFSFDDDVAVAAAKADPTGFVSDLPARTILDEIQRVPELFTALKLTVDHDRTPGRFILTGSANTLLVPRLADSLAGRMEILRLHPLAQCELAGKVPSFIDRLFDGDFQTRTHDRLGEDLSARIVSGGYPVALARPTHRRRSAWYRNYIETIIQRDVRDLARIRALDALPRLLELAAGQTAQLLNVSDLASPFQLSRPTIREYVTLLERIFLLDILPPWHSNRTSRLIKTPKVHVGDTGVACSLFGLDTRNLARNREILGHLVETFVFQELRRQASWHGTEIRFHHFRNKDDFEVDIVLERAAHEVAGIEVKASATVANKDFRGLRKLKQVSGERFTTGIILYDGQISAGFGDRLYAVPIRTLWEA
jgi:predicted AAA+ superfamily ATPase